MRIAFLKPERLYRAERKTAKQRNAGKQQHGRAIPFKTYVAHCNNADDQPDDDIDNTQQQQDDAHRQEKITCALAGNHAEGDNNNNGQVGKRYMLELLFQNRSGLYFSSNVLRYDSFSSL